MSTESAVDLTFDSVESLRLIQETAVKASDSEGKAHVLTIENGRRPVKMLVSRDGSIPLNDDLPKQPRRSMLKSVADVEKYIEWATIELKANPTVWISEGYVYITLFDKSDSDRLDQAIVTLEPTPSFHFLSEVAAAGTTEEFDHRQFLRLLRRKLGDCLDERGHDVVKRLSKMRFSSSRSGKSEVGQGNASYGADIENKAWSELGDIPESIFLDVKLYTDPVLRARRKIECVLEVDPEAKTFAIYPLAGQIGQAEADERKAIATVMDLACPVFEGTP